MLLICTWSSLLLAALILDQARADDPTVSSFCCCGRARPSIEAMAALAERCTELQVPAVQVAGAVSLREVYARSQQKCSAFFSGPGHTTGWPGLPELEGSRATNRIFVAPPPSAVGKHQIPFPLEKSPRNHFAMTRISLPKKTPKKREEVRGKADVPGRRKLAEPGRGDVPGPAGVPATRSKSARGGLIAGKRHLPPAIAGEFGKRIRELREQKGLSQEQLSLRAGLGRAAVGEIECGQANGRLSTLKALKRALGISIELLMRGVA